VVILRCWWLDMAIRPAQHPVIQLYNNKETKFRENRLPRSCQPKIRRNHPANRLILRYFPALG